MAKGNVFPEVNASIFAVIIVNVTADNGPDKTALWIPKNHKKQSSTWMKIIVNGLAIRLFKGALMISVTKLKISSNGVNEKAIRMPQTIRKIIVTIKVGANDSETIGGTESGNLIVNFLAAKIEYSLVINKATSIPIKIPCPPK